MCVHLQVEPQLLAVPSAYASGCCGGAAAVLLPHWTCMRVSTSGAEQCTHLLLGLASPKNLSLALKPLTSRMKGAGLIQVSSSPMNRNSGSWLVCCI